MEKFGRPTFFITCTANRDWPEIREAAASAADRADLIVRVFRQKYNMLLRALREGKIFGRRSVYILSVIEFQKRGEGQSLFLFAFSYHVVMSSRTSTQLCGTLYRCSQVYRIATLRCGSKGISRSAQRTWTRTCLPKYPISPSARIMPAASLAIATCTVCTRSLRHA